MTKVIYLEARGADNIMRANSIQVDIMVVCLIVDTLQIFLIAFVSLKYARTAKGITVCFLAQCYLSTGMAFGGIFLDLFMLIPSDRAFSIIANSKANSNGKLPDVNTDNTYHSAVMLFQEFSFIILTGCGGTGSLYPKNGMLIWHVLLKWLCPYFTTSSSLDMVLSSFRITEMTT